MIVKFDKYVAHNNTNVVQINKTNEWNYKQEQPAQTKKNMDAKYFCMAERTHVPKRPY